ncbi:hypothetical protein AWC19_00170 [Mycobacterium palustre]|uniref:Uncharacterized protein n=1 Tax=Mycobacterium palustre TaxID=153971 RepID=A0A1X1ZKY2_9MYCO|nr:hypothetical protein AWC19_00170 [Mycobacterium palustre]
MAAGLTNLIEIDVQRVPNTDSVQCRIRPWSADGAQQNGVADPGGWLAVDGTNVVGMSNVDYAAQFTQNVPLEWAATTTAPVATLNEDGTVTLTFPQPTSANRPFTYTATGPGTVGPFTTDPSGSVSATITGLTGDTLGPWTVECATQYEGVTATSVASNTIAVPQPGG